MLVSDFFIIGDVRCVRLRLQSNQRHNIGDALGLRLAFDLRRVSTQRFSCSELKFLGRASTHRQ
jgi:hypothetical protein